jgi:plastocyanin
MKMKSRTVSILGFLGALLSGTSGIAHANIIDVNQTNTSFVPRDIIINVGDTVRWHWSSLSHTVTEGDTLGITGMEAFNQPLTMSNPLVQVTFDAAFLHANPRPNNFYHYNCQIHFLMNMKGTIQVNPVPGAQFCFGDGSTTTNCPCGNFGMAGHGCQNSASTGGSVLSSAGESGPDSVVLLASGELPSAFSLFLQGNASSMSGIVFGDGVRCVSGTLKRLYAKTASNGSVSAPQGADPSITTRSAALGDPIAPGSTRYYAVYYRDANSTFCPPATFNVSNSVSIVWP